MDEELLAMMADLGNHRAEENAQAEARDVSVREDATGPAASSRPMSDGANMWRNAIGAGAFEDDDAARVAGLENIGNGRLHASRINVTLTRGGGGGRGGFHGGVGGRGGRPPRTSSVVDTLLKNVPGFQKPLGYDPSNPQRRAHNSRRGGKPNGGNVAVSSLGGLLPPGAEATQIKRWVNGSLVGGQSNSSPPGVSGSGRGSPHPLPHQAASSSSAAKPGPTASVRSGSARPPTTRATHPPVKTQSSQDRHTTVPPHLRTQPKGTSSSSIDKSGESHVLSKSDGAKPAAKRSTQTTASPITTTESLVQITTSPVAAPNAANSPQLISVSVSNETNSKGATEPSLGRNVPSVPRQPVEDIEIPGACHIDCKISHSIMLSCGDSVLVPGRSFLYTSQDQDVAIWEFHLENGDMIREDVGVIMDVYASNARMIVSRQTYRGGPIRHSILLFQSSLEAETFREEIYKLKEDAKVKKSSAPRVESVSRKGPAPATNAQAKSTPTAKDKMEPKLSPQTKVRPQVDTNFKTETPKLNGKPNANEDASMIDKPQSPNQWVVPHMRKKSAANTAIASLLDIQKNNGLTNGSKDTIKSIEISTHDKSATVVTHTADRLSTVHQQSSLSSLAEMSQSPTENLDDFQLVDTAIPERAVDTAGTSRSADELAGLTYQDQPWILSPQANNFVPTDALATDRRSAEVSSPVESVMSRGDSLDTSSLTRWNVDVPTIEGLHAGEGLSRSSKQALSGLGVSQYNRIVETYQTVISIGEAVGMFAANPSVQKDATLHVCLRAMQNLPDSGLTELDPEQTCKTMAVVYSNVRRMLTGSRRIRLVYNRDKIIRLKDDASSKPTALDEFDQYLESEGLSDRAYTSDSSTASSLGRKNKQRKASLASSIPTQGDLSSGSLVENQSSVLEVQREDPLTASTPGKSLSSISPTQDQPGVPQAQRQNSLASSNHNPARAPVDEYVAKHHNSLASSMHSPVFQSPVQDQYMFEPARESSSALSIHNPAYSPVSPIQQCEPEPSRRNSLAASIHAKSPLSSPIDSKPSAAKFTSRPQEVKTSGGNSGLNASRWA